MTKPEIFSKWKHMTNGDKYSYMFQNSQLNGMTLLLGSLDFHMILACMLGVKDQSNNSMHCAKKSHYPPGKNHASHFEKCHISRS